jgi:hypothetical protein
MGRPKASTKARRATVAIARGSPLLKKKRQGCGKFLGILPDSPLISPPAKEVRESKRPDFFKPDVNIVQRHHCPSSSTTSPSSSSASPPFITFPKENNMEQILFEYNNKWLAVISFLVESKKDGSIGNEKCNQIAAFYNIGTGKTLRRLHQRVMEQGTVFKKQRVYTKKLPYKDIEQFMQEKAKEMDYHFTHATMLLLVKQKFGVGSGWLIQKIFAQYGWTKVYTSSSTFDQMKQTHAFIYRKN